MLVKKSSNSKFSAVVVLLWGMVMLHGFVHPGVLVAKDTLTSTRIPASLTFSYLTPANQHFLFLLTPRQWPRSSYEFAYDICVACE